MLRLLTTMSTPGFENEEQEKHTFILRINLDRKNTRIQRLSRIPHLRPQDQLARNRNHIKRR